MLVDESYGSEPRISLPWANERLESAVDEATLYGREDSREVRTDASLTVIDFALDVPSADDSAASDAEVVDASPSHQQARPRASWARERLDTDDEPTLVGAERQEELRDQPPLVVRHLPHGGSI